MAHVHGLWLYACGHEAFRCRCIDHAPEPPRYRTDLCAECRAKITQPPTPTDATPKPAKEREPFPKATD